MSFFIRKRLFTTTVQMNIVKKLTVIGGGLMGSGIAQVAAQTGHNVTLVDLSPQILNRAVKQIDLSLTKVAKTLYRDNSVEADQFIYASKDRLKVSTDASKAVEDSDLVIEAIVESIDAKHALFKILDEAAPPKTIFASNTSSLNISEIAAPVKRKDRFGGMHFFSPVPVMKLLEVIRTPDTSEEAHNKMMACGRAMKKVCIACKDTPGFIVNRLLLPYMSEAMKMLERGDATPQDIDLAMKLGAGYPMGPFELADYVGNDISLAVLQTWNRKYPNDPAFQVSGVLKKLVQENKLGCKTGEGFYKYSK
ncbi:hypothetical protein PPYR_13025 [Photinus pyralis]|uniref:3-hydroxyacyl-CoA dehydrogenase n=2 Tax=Photinus pyralis TaxID=7054 RepID=A0A1Y1L3D7_PHOPY|nr:hydroxyacyl-coenzyme A dehydrogenase, mitochondrial-like [Photinus pyralis]KAB0793405.1 hypothetical protein PPYR_13025 [Photinus pyralis]